jgi:hypothetical protein
MTDDRAYRVHVRFDAEAEKFHARAPELELSASGATRADALAALEADIESRFQALADGATLPRPVDAQTFSGELSVKLSQSLRRELAFIAREDGLTPEALAAELIARALGDHRRRGRGAPAPQPTPAPSADAQPRDEDAQPGNTQRRDDRGPRHDDRGPRGDGRGRGGPRGGNGGNGGNAGGGNDRRRGEGYRPELDDKANFLEYLRGLEKRGPRGR